LKESQAQYDIRKEYQELAYENQLSIGYLRGDEIAKEVAQQNQAMNQEQRALAKYQYYAEDVPKQIAKNTENAANLERQIYYENLELKWKVEVKKLTASRNTESILSDMHQEIDMIGKVDQTWERSREFIKLQDAAMIQAKGNMEEYNLIMAEGRDIFEQVADKKRWLEMSRAIEGPMTNALESLIFESEKFGDVMKNLLQEILMQMIRISVIRPAAEWLSMGTLGVATAIGSALFDRGGIAGRTNAPMMAMPASAYLNAPVLDSGFWSDHYPAVLQRGEKVIPAGVGGHGSGSPPTVIINCDPSKTGIQMKQQGNWKFDGNKWVMSIVCDAWDRGHPFRDKVLNAR
jgi:hypothetical protein